MHNATTSKEYGKPTLPVFYYTFYIPKGQKVYNVVFTPLNEEDIVLEHQLIPLQRPGKTGISKSDQTFYPPDLTAYNSTKSYPLTQAKIYNNSTYDNDFQIVTIEVCPFQYFPVSKTLKFYSSVNISFKQKSFPEDSIFSIAKHHKQRIDFLNSIIENPQDLYFDINKKSSGTFNNSPVDKISNDHSLRTLSVGQNWSEPFFQYEVITSKALGPYFSNFIRWKNRKGYNAGIVYIEDILNDPVATGDPVSSTLNDNAGKLRQYLSAAYNNGNGVLEYVLLGGDGTVIPFRYGEDSTLATYSIPSDLYFSNFDSNWDILGKGPGGPTGVYYTNFDLSPEIYVGRLLCNSAADINNWTIKTLTYEQNPGNGDYSYLSKVLFTESDGINSFHVDTPFNPIFYQTSLPPYLQNNVTSWSELPFDDALYPYFPKGADIINALNSHYGLYSIFNHGSPNRYSPCTAGDASLHGEFTNLPGAYYSVCSGDTLDGYFGTPPFIFPYNLPSSVDGTELPESGNGFDNLTNLNYPCIIYSPSCSNIPFDNYDTKPGFRNLGTIFTVSPNGGGPVYLGNTRDGTIGLSQGLEVNFFKSISINNSFGFAEGHSKIGNIDFATVLAHNLIGDPELSMWTTSPLTVKPTIKLTPANDSSTLFTISVNPNINQLCKICVMSQENTASYKEVKDTAGLTTQTFNNVPVPFYITITSNSSTNNPDNYIPYLYSYTSSTKNGFENGDSMQLINNSEVIKIYPNPSSTTVTVNNQSDEIYKIEIFNLSGGLIDEVQSCSGIVTMNISGYPVGIYIIEVLTPSGRFISKLVKN